MIGNKGYVDFKEPIEMSNKEKELFIELLKSIFSPTVVKDENCYYQDFRDWRIGDKKRYPRKWIAEEYEILLRYGYDNGAEKIGRSPMAAFIMYSVWLPKLMLWCNIRGKNLLTGNKLKIIKEFLKEREELLKKGEKRGNQKG